MPPKRPITAEDLYNLQFVEDPQISPDGKRIAFVKMTIDKLGNKYSRNIWIAEPNGRSRRLRQFTFGGGSAHSPRWSPDGSTLAFISNRDGKSQLYLIGLDGGEARAITSMPNGLSLPVWSAAGTRLAWSPDGKRIAFAAPVNAEERRREDSGREEAEAESALELQQRKEREKEKEKAKTDPRIITRLPYRSGTEFFDDRRWHIYVMDAPDAESKPPKPYRLTEGELDFTQIAWTKDGQSVISAQSRTPDTDPWEHVDLIRLSAVGRRKPFRRLTKAGHDYAAPEVSPDGKWIATLRQVETGSSGRTQHLAVLPTGGGAARDLTLELDRTVEQFRWSADSRWLYFVAGDHGDTGIYRVRTNGGAIEKVIGGRRAVLGFSLSKSNQLAFAACTPERPVDLYTARSDGKSEKRLSDFNGGWLAQLEIAKTEELNYAAPDGRAIQGWLIKPGKFRKGKKYPLAVNVHGGPHIMWGPSTPSMWLEMQLHAARGYAVFYCNPRGSDGYGEEHTTIITGDWGDHVMRDILTGVDRAAEKGFVDTTRMALTGGSYAGYMAAWIVGHDRRFACAWAQRGLYNMISFYGVTDIPHFLEREFDDATPFDNLEKSWKQSPLAYVRDIRTPLAIEHQENDYRCPISDAEQLFTALKRLKRTVVFYRYPREGHEMSRSGEPRHRVDRLNRMTAWFDKYCMKG